MQEIFFLLLPIAAAYGWYMGRRSARQHQTNQRKQLSRDYFAGLNFLLSNESDKAVDLFISMLDVDDETIDTHLSLGSLFRKRGEVDRSIRIHQNLIARPNLAIEQRDMAMMELGKDYLAAGLYDRAEEIFVTLVNQDEHSDESETQLIAIYQITKEWQKAIDIVKKLKRKRQQSFKHDTAHFYCELAQEADTNDMQVRLLQSAIKQDPLCGRALLTLAKLYLTIGDYRHCKLTLEKLLEADVNLLADALPTIKEVFLAHGDKDDYQDFLTHALQQGAGATVAVTLAQFMIDSGKNQEAEKLVLEGLYRHPTMKSFQHLIKIHLQQAEDGQAKKSLTMLEQLVEQQIKYRPGFRCNECGFPSHQLYWHCPSCKGWGSIQRIRGLDGE